MGNDDISDGVKAIAGLVGVVLAATVGLGILSAIVRTESGTKRVRVNPNRVCDSCKEDYILSEGGYLDFCSDECNERGALRECYSCHDDYFENEGEDDNYCSNSCYWDANLD